MTLHLPPRRAVASAALGVAPLLALAGCGGSAASSSSASAATSGPAAQQVPVTLSDAGCTPSSFTLKPGTIIFTVTNSGSTDVEEMEIDDPKGTVMGDVEGVQPGKTRSFVVDLTVGSYEVKCPQEATTFGTLTIR